MQPASTSNIMAKYLDRNHFCIFLLIDTWTWTLLHPDASNLMIRFNPDKYLATDYEWSIHKTQTKHQSAGHYQTKPDLKNKTIMLKKRASNHMLENT
jgi:hypothetical protein